MLLSKVSSGSFSEMLVWLVTEAKVESTEEGSEEWNARLSARQTKESLFNPANALVSLVQQNKI